jgi:polyhydroxyalkanoate synthesis regulator phasin
MNKLKKEAEEHSRQMWGVYYNDKHPDIAITKTQGEISIDDFIAGAKSKHVEIEKIKSLIDENRSVVKMLHIHGTERSVFRVNSRIDKLQKQLKVLYDESKRNSKEQ